MLFVLQNRLAVGQVALRREILEGDGRHQDQARRGRLGAGDVRQALAAELREALKGAAAPLVLAFPLFLVLFGRSSLTVIVMSTITGLAPIIIKTTEGLASVRPVLINVGKSLKLTDSQMFWKILMPAALPVIFSGIRLSWTFVLISVVGIEFLINLGGLGQLINDLAERYDMPGTYAAIAFVIIVSVCFFMLLERVETWLRPSR